MGSSKHGPSVVQVGVGLKQFAIHLDHHVEHGLLPHRVGQDEVGVAVAQGGECDKIAFNPAFYQFFVELAVGCQLYERRDDVDVTVAHVFLAVVSHDFILGCYFCCFGRLGLFHHAKPFGKHFFGLLHIVVKGIFKLGQLVEHLFVGGVEAPHYHIGLLVAVHVDEGTRLQ